MNSKNDALEFIAAYYSTMAFCQSDLPKFYDDAALISRPSYQEPKLISEAQNQLAFLINRGSPINIISTTSIPNNDYLAISIVGSVVVNGNENIFTQMFVLQEKYDRLYITSDSIQLIEPFKPENNFNVNKRTYFDPYHNINSDTNSNFSEKEQNNPSNKKYSQEKKAKKKIVNLTNSILDC